MFWQKLGTEFIGCTFIINSLLESLYSISRYSISRWSPATTNLRIGYRFWQQRASAGYLREVEVAAPSFSDTYGAK